MAQQDKRKHENEPHIMLSSIQSLKSFHRSSWRTKAYKFMPWLRWIAIVMLAIALWRPQTVRKKTQLRTDGIDMMLVLDTSGSMQALDLDIDKPIAKRKNRLEVVKGVVQTFIEKRTSDPIGMVVFGEQAYTQCPLTLDHGILTGFLSHIHIGMAGDQTAMGSGLAVAVKRLQKSQAKSKVIIALTDGRHNAGAITPTQAAEMAASFGIKIYTIGAGVHGKAPFLADSLFGQQVVYEDVEIDEDTLKEVARMTGGAYFRAEDNKALASIYEQIDALEKTTVESTAYIEYDEHFAIFVWVALFLLFSERVLLGTWLRKVP